MSKMLLKTLTIAFVLGAAAPGYSQTNSPPPASPPTAPAPPSPQAATPTPAQPAPSGVATASPNAGNAGAADQDFGYPTKDGGFYKYQGPQDSPPRSNFYGRT